jgi:predicted nucleic acid-binding protein
MKKLFVDTWFWLTLIIQTEEFHRQADEYFLKGSYQGDEFYTSGSVIAETINSILHSKTLIKAPEKRLRPDYAFGFFEKFEKVLETNSNLKILIADQTQISKALEFLKGNFRSMPRLSYFDCESVVLCQAHGLPRVLTKDSDFESLGVPIDEDWKAALREEESK